MAPIFGTQPFDWLTIRNRPVYNGNNVKFDANQPLRYVYLTDDQGRFLTTGPVYLTDDSGNILIDSSGHPLLASDQQRLVAQVNVTQGDLYRFV